jgi:hypothetical protein
MYNVYKIDAENQKRRRLLIKDEDKLTERRDILTEKYRKRIGKFVK